MSPRLERVESILIREVNELTNQLKKYKRLSLTDPLTQLYNSRKLEKDIANAKYNSKRYKQKYLLVYLDLDEFKKINDEKGHKEGNKILIKFSNILKKNVRRIDTIYRLGEGADEFVILLKHCYKKTAKIIMKRIEQNSIEFSYGIGKTLKEAEKEMYKNKKEK